MSLCVSNLRTILHIAENKFRKKGKSSACLVFELLVLENYNLLSILFFACLVFELRGDRATVKKRVKLAFWQNFIDTKPPPPPHARVDPKSPLCAAQSGYFSISKIRFFQKNFLKSPQCTRRFSFFLKSP